MPIGVFHSRCYFLGGMRKDLRAGVAQPAFGLDADEVCAVGKSEGRFLKIAEAELGAMFIDSKKDGKLAQTFVGGYSGGEAAFGAEPGLAENFFDVGFGSAGAAERLENDRAAGKALADFVADFPAEIFGGGIIFVDQAPFLIEQVINKDGAVDDHENHQRHVQFFGKLVSEAINLQGVLRIGSFIEDRDPAVDGWGNKRLRGDDLFGNAGDCRGVSGMQMVVYERGGHIVEG